MTDMAAAESVFNIERRIFPAVQPRLDRRAVQHADDRLEIVGKIYTPKSNTNPQKGDVTIVAAHANGLGKELYEPLFVALLYYSVHARFRIRYILITDIVNQGESGVRNELGDCMSWTDVSRDLFVILQILRPPQPVFAMGHSMGGAQLFNLAVLHPSLFSGIIGIDPIIESKEDATAVGLNPAKLSSHRKDVWPSKEEAIKYFKKRTMYRRWDPRVFDLWIKYGLRDLPTNLYREVHGSSADSNQTQVTLTTTRYQEVWTFVTVNPDYLDKVGNSPPPLDRPDSVEIFDQLHKVKIPTLFITGGQSDVNDRIHKKTAVMKHAKLITINNASHFIPFEEVEGTAEHVIAFLSKVLEQWQRDNYDDERTPRDTGFNSIYVAALDIRNSKL
ncbi:alpha/beta-hydrolase [Lipomyces tetrasporus]